MAFTGCVTKIEFAPYKKILIKVKIKVISEIGPLVQETSLKTT